MSAKSLLKIPFLSKTWSGRYQQALDEEMFSKIKASYFSKESKPEWVSNKV